MGDPDIPWNEEEGKSERENTGTKAKHYRYVYVLAGLIRGGHGWNGTLCSNLDPLLTYTQHGISFASRPTVDSKPSKNMWVAPLYGVKQHQQKLKKQKNKWQVSTRLSPAAPPACAPWPCSCTQGTGTLPQTRSPFRRRASGSPPARRRRHRPLTSKLDDNTPHQACMTKTHTKRGDRGTESELDVVNIHEGTGVFGLSGRIGRWPRRRVQP